MLKYIQILSLLLLPAQVWGGVFVGFVQSSTPTITYTETYTANTATASPLTINTPSPLNDGDLLVMFANNDDAPDMTATGWTSIRYITLSGGSADLGLWYKIASSEGSSYNITATTMSQAVGAVLRFTKNSGTFVVTNSNSAIITATAGDITVSNVSATAGGYLVCVFGSDDAVTYTTPADMTQAVALTPNSSRGVVFVQAITSSADYSKTTTAGTGDSGMICAGIGLE